MLMLYFENLTFGVIMSWSGRVIKNGHVLYKSQQHQKQRANWTTRWY